MDIQTIRTRIYDQQALFFTEQNSGVGTAKRYLPRTIVDAELPVFMTLTADATYARRYATSFEETRIFTMQLFLDSLAKGVEGQLEEDTETFIAKVQNFWGARTRLELNGNDVPNSIDSSELVGDAGVRSGQYPNTQSAPQYLILEFRLRVVWERHIQYK